MSYDKVMQANQVVIGTKQTMKMIEKGSVLEVYIAQDADQRLITKVESLSRKMGVQITYVDSMKRLGKACGIEVGTAMAASIKE